MLWGNNSAVWGAVINNKWNEANQSFESTSEAIHSCYFERQKEAEYSVCKENRKVIRNSCSHIKEISVLEKYYRSSTLRFKNKAKEVVKSSWQQVGIALFRFWEKIEQEQNYFKGPRRIEREKKLSLYRVLRYAYKVSAHQHVCRSNVRFI